LNRGYHNPQRGGVTRTESAARAHAAGAQGLQIDKSVATRYLDFIPLNTMKPDEALGFTSWWWKNDEERDFETNLRGGHDRGYGAAGFRRQ